ncbi:HAMP domain-containing sensor histidine kinase [Bacteroides sp.]|uniref:sensor histidine kinase n=1 Tax=Bacteroides sp. TaxID=29523 RepID=UPI002606E24C|nr:HAMP domain-containing sensor histidine kinase [Bacteroides sp.]
MKKYYYIAIIAAFATVFLQTIYVISLYNQYFDENIIRINDALHVAIDKEMHLRSLEREGKKTREHQYLYIKSIDDMSPQERDSLQRLSPIGNGYIYNIDAARKKGIGTTASDLIMQVGQDELLKDGFSLHLKVLDSIFVKTVDVDCRHRVLLYNENKELVETTGDLGDKKPNFTSADFRIGTKGLQCLRIEVNIPIVPFVGQQVWILISSVWLMLLVILCLSYQLITIRRKDALLHKREDSINGTIHDLKAPLNSVLATLGWLQSDETNLPKKKAVEISRAEVRHLVCNIESLLVTVRKDRKRLILKKEEIDILHLTEMVKHSMDALYRAKPHTIEIVDELPVGVKVIADGLYIENVIRNLMENALKYSDDGVKVKVTLSIVNSMLRVSVQDNGWGIAPKYQQKLFRQFYQVPRGEERICKGYGIGLAQSKYIIDEHKGKIKVESAKEKGSIFTFTIPLV